MAETIQNVSLQDETERRYLTYAVSVVTSRALPDVRDGLKPVQRRILYTMYNDLHLTFDGRTRKCAKIVGDVLGNYHPHGDDAAYDALVRLAQNWVMRVPLVNGQGNFGSVDGDSPAHRRYTEAKLTTVSERLMSELRQRTVPMRPNYENTREEPVVLPVQFPNLLVNGSSGIAVGLATNIPPHNLGEVIRASVLLIDNPEATTAQIMEKLKGPDFPLGGRIITDRATLRKIYEEGTGGIKVQGEWKLEEEGKKQQIVVTSIPYGVDKGKLESDIGLLINERKLPQLLNVSNEMNEKEGIRTVLEIKPGTDPNLIMAYLYKHTALQESFHVNLTHAWFRSTTRTARNGRRKRAPAGPQGDVALLPRFPPLATNALALRVRVGTTAATAFTFCEGFRIIFNALDRAIKIIRQSSGKADASEKPPRSGSTLDEEQAGRSPSTLELYKIAHLEIKKILDELKEKRRKRRALSRSWRRKRSYGAW